MAPTIYERSEIGLADPRRRPDGSLPFIVPPEDRLGLVGHHNGPKMRLDLQWSRSRLVARELELVRGIQRYHQLTLGWSDTAYSWFLGQSGNIYTARGWMWDQFANGADQVGPDDGPDRSWYTVMCMIGWDPDDGTEEEPSPAMRESFLWLVAEIRARGGGDRVLPHNSFKVKRCPGRSMTELCEFADRNPDLTATAPTQGAEPLSAIPVADWRKLYNDATVDKYNSVVEFVQEWFLAPLGLYTGAIDGLKGNQTNLAWAAWEHRLGNSQVNHLAGSKSWGAMLEALAAGLADNADDLALEAALARIDIARSAIAAAQADLAAAQRELE